MFAAFVQKINFFKPQVWILNVLQCLIQSKKGLFYFLPNLISSLWVFSVICNKTERKKVKETYQRKHILKQNLKKGLSPRRGYFFYFYKIGFFVLFLQENKKIDCNKVVIRFLLQSLESFLKSFLISSYA